MINKQQPTQKDKFLQTAKEHGCDESVEAFENKLKKISKVKPIKKEKD